MDNESDRLGIAQDDATSSIDDYAVADEEGSGVTTTNGSYMADPHWQQEQRYTRRQNAIDFASRLQHPKGGDAKALINDAERILKFIEG